MKYRLRITLLFLLYFSFIKANETLESKLFKNLCNLITKYQEFNELQKHMKESKIVVNFENPEDYKIIYDKNVRKVVLDKFKSLSRQQQVFILSTEFNLNFKLGARITIIDSLNIFATDLKNKFGNTEFEIKNYRDKTVKSQIIVLEKFGIQNNQIMYVLSVDNSIYKLTCKVNMQISSLNNIEFKQFKVDKYE
ncbi:MAG: hypothetical protein ACOVOQ_12535 [Flavobacterium sp.]